MQIFKIDTDGNAAVKEIEGDLKSLQTEVGGLITLANYYEELEEQGIDIFADDEGLLKANPKVSLFVTDKKNEKPHESADRACRKHYIRIAR